MLPRFVRFGEFELDREGYQLLRQGAAVKMENLPLQLLMLLVARRGQMVSRPDIEESLWGKDVFVDVEQGINTAIRKIRQILRDHRENPRYLQTVVGKGYRFLATDVTESDGAGSGTPALGEDGVRATVTLEELGEAILAASGLQCAPLGVPSFPRDAQGNMRDGAGSPTTRRDEIADRHQGMTRRDVPSLSTPLNEHE